MRTRIDFVLVAALLLCAVAPPARAQDPNNGSQIVVQSNYQIGQQIVPDGAGGVIAVWTDGRNGISYDIYAQRIDASGSLLWNTSGVIICSAPQTQDNLRVIPDGLGGAIVAWQDNRTSSYDIYAQRINAAGQTQWTFNGVPLCQAGNQQEYPDLISDGSGGAIVTWQDVRSGEYDIYAQRIGANGTTQWTINGINLTTQGSYQQFPAIVRDGAGGCIVAWQDSRNGPWDIYAQRLNSSGVALWQSNGIEVSAAPGEQRAHRIVEDGAGGVILAWEDLRNGPTHIYAQRLNSGGVALWTVNGAAVLTSAAGAKTPRVTSDGSAGAIIAWEDARNGGSNWDIYAQRIPSGGIPAWTGNGIAVCAVSGIQSLPQIEAAGAGGAIVTWQDERFGNSDIFAQRIDGAGLLQWSADGEALCLASGTQTVPMVTSDGAGGAIVAWQDGRYATSWDLFCQRITSTRALGFPDAERPLLVSVRDTPNDQGGQVKISWRGSNRDLAPIADVSEYRIWRSVPPNNAVASLHVADLVRDPEPGTIVPMNSAAGISYWEFLATRPAGRLTGYSYVAATTSDSIPGSNPKTAFMIEARTLNGASWWYSNADSGYSVDNLPPYVVMGLAGTYTPGEGLSMHWRANSDADLASYVIHRGATADFVPGTGNLIGTTADTAFVDPAGSFNYYKVAAVDVHSNRGPFATLASQDVPVGTLLGRFEAEEEGATIRITVGLSEQAAGMTVRILRATEPDLGLAQEIVISSSSIENGMRSYVDASVEAGQSYWYWVELRDADGIVAVTGPVVATTAGALVTFVRSAYPNPMRSSTVFSYAIGRDVAPTGSARVSLRIYDARGRALRTLFDEMKATGEHETTWDGADARGARLSNGIYFWQLQAGAVVKRGSVVMMR